MPRTSNRGKRMTTGGSAPHSHPAGAAAIHHSIDTDESTPSSPSTHQPHPMQPIVYSSDDESVITTYPSNVDPPNQLDNFEEARQLINQQQTTIADLNQELIKANKAISELEEDGDRLWGDYERLVEENNTVQITLRHHSESDLIASLGLQPVNSENSQLRLRIASLESEVEQLRAHNDVLAGRIDARGRPAPLYSPTSPSPQSPPNSSAPMTTSRSPTCSPQSTHAGTS
jgi:prefoldin subunit 5